MRPAAARASTASGRHLGRAAAEASVGGQEVGGDRYARGVGRHSLCHPGRREPDLPNALAPSPSRPRWPSTPRPRRSRRRARTSSASAPASPISRPPSTSWRRPSPPAATRRTTTTRRSPACPSCGRPSPSRPSATRATSATPARSSSPTAASRPSTTPSRPCSTRATRSSCRRPYWTTYPEAIALAGGVPVEVATDVAAGLPRHRSTSSTGPLTDRTKALLFVSPSNPTGAVYPAGRGGGHRPVGGRARHLGGHRRDLRAPDLRRPRVHLDAGARARSRRHAASSLNGVAKTYAMTGWRVGWMIGPDDVIAAATNLQSHATSNVANVSQRAALAAVSGDLEAVAEMRAAFDRRGRTMHELLSAIPGVTLPRAAGRLLLLPVVRGRARAARSAGATPSTHAGAGRRGAVGGQGGLRAR